MTFQKKLAPIPVPAEETSPPAAGTGPDFGMVLGLLQDITGKLDRQGRELDELRAKVAATDQALPKFVPMERPPPPTNPNGIMATLGRNGQVNGNFDEIPRGQDGRPLSDYVMDLRPPTYRVGAHVRINPAVAREGFPRTGDVIGKTTMVVEGKPISTPILQDHDVTWAERLAKARATGEGTITRILHLRRDGQWRYVGKFPGIQGPNGLDVTDAELLPA